MKKGEKKNIRTLRKKFFFIYILAIFIIGFMLFLPAGTLNYLQAWAFIVVLFLPVTFVMFYFLKHDPELLERRLRYKAYTKKLRYRLIPYIW